MIKIEDIFSSGDFIISKGKQIYQVVMPNESSVSVKTLDGRKHFLLFEKDVLQKATKETNPELFL